jgi:predicted nucleotidyltransferase
MWYICFAKEKREKKQWKQDLTNSQTIWLFGIYNSEALSVDLYPENIVHYISTNTDSTLQNVE